MTKHEEGASALGELFVPGATEFQAREIQAAALLPEGSVVLRLDAKSLYEQPGRLTVLQVPSGACLLRLTRDEKQRLAFTHATPGTGTRVAALSLPPFVDGSKFVVSMTWSESSADLYAGFVGSEPAHAAGAITPSRVRVSGGHVFQVGDDALEVMGYQVFAGGTLVLRETSTEVWHSTKQAIDLHMRGSTVDGYIGEVIQANLALLMIATGFETYCGRRFGELSSEGRNADVESFAQAMVPKKYFDADRFKSLEDVLGAQRVDFGNYETCKKAFRSAYGLRMALDLGLTHETLEAVRRMLTYRQRIAHVSPLIGFLNQPWAPPEEPVFAGKQLVGELLAATDSFVQGLHAATLRLR